MCKIAGISSKRVFTRESRLKSLWPKRQPDTLEDMRPISNPSMHTTIVGAANMEHLADNLRTAELGPLPPDVYAEAQRRLSTATQSS